MSSNSKQSEEGKPTDPDEDADYMDAKDYILERIYQMKKAGVVFHSTDDDPNPDHNPTGHSMFPSRQKFGRSSDRPGR